MVVKLKDIYKLANHIGDFLKKLDSDSEFAIIRDTLNLALLNLQRFHKLLNYQFENFSSTKFVIVDKYSWKWVELPNKKYPSSLPVVLEAIKMQNFDKVKAYLQEGVSNKCDLIDRTALYYGVHYFDKNIFQHLIESETNINETNNEGQNVLHLACKESNLFAVKALLARNADVYSSDEFGRTGMHWAVTTSDTSCLKCLLDNGCDPFKCSDYEGMTPTMWAACLDKLDHLKLLLNSNKSSSNKKKVGTDDDDDDDGGGGDDDGEEKDRYGRMWIHWCVHSSGDHLCLKEFLNKEILKVKDNLGRSVVHVAAEKGSIEAMMTICSIGGDDVIEERDDLDRTPLIIASMGGQGELINHLLNMGADILKVDRFGASAWDYARSNQLHYCMLIIASYLRQSTNQIPSFDPSSSINFNQSLRLSLTRSRSLELQQDSTASSKRQTVGHLSVGNLESSDPRNEGGLMRPHPPKSPNISPPRNFRRRRTPPRHENPSTINDNPNTRTTNDDEEELTASTTPGRRSRRTEGRTKRITKRHTLRRDVTVATDSSSDAASDGSRSTERNSRRRSVENVGVVPDVLGGNDDFEQSSARRKKMQKFRKQSQDLPDFAFNSDDSKAFNIPSDNKKSTNKLRKVNFNLDERNDSETTKVDVSNMVAKKKFAKWDVNFSDQQSREHDQNASNPWHTRAHDDQTTSVVDFNVSSNSRLRPLTPIGDNPRLLPVRRSENKLPKKLEKTSTRLRDDDEEVRGPNKYPTPAPRRSSFDLKKWPA